MDTYSFPVKTKKAILALGAESDGNFCFFKAGKIYFSESFGDLLEETNWQKFQETVLEFLKKNKLKPDIILTDLHPLYLTSVWGEELAKKYKAKHIQVQHHFAHIFSVIGERIMHDTSYVISNTFYGIAMDGTGYGEDGKIWGGEIFKIKNQNSKFKIIERIGHLENQILIGGDLAVREPARMLIGILDKAVSPSPFGRGWSALGGPGEGKGELSRKNAIYQYIKKYYTKNEFELIHNQLKQNFNCLETSSTGRILDAVSLLLGFCGNERKYKHEPIALLEANSTKPYADIKPKITLSQGNRILSTAFLFEYLVKNLHKDKKRLASTAQLYIAEGLYKIIKKDIPNTSYQIPATFLAGGIASNKIISKYLISQGAYASSEIPRGDAGLSFGQIVYYLLSK
ncbi:MAG: hypothetical protein WAV73_03370 [Candidatus Moraniibacteriota bacterium]